MCGYFELPLWNYDANVATKSDAIDERFLTSLFSCVVLWARSPLGKDEGYWASWAPFTTITAAVVPPPCTCSPCGPHRPGTAAPKSHIVGDGISIPTLSETRNLLSRSQIPPASPLHILHLLWCTFCVYLNCDLGHPLELLRCDVSRGYGGGQAEGSGSLAGRGSRASGAGLE